MALPGMFASVVSDGESATESSLQLIETLQQALNQRRSQLEDIQERQKSLAEEYARLTAAATNQAQQFSGMMRELETDNLAPVDLGDVGLGRDGKTSRWKSSVMLGRKASKKGDTEAA